MPVEEDFVENWPVVLPIHDENSNVGKWIAGHQTEFDALDGDIDAVVDSRQIENATGTELDEIGALFGDIGKRRGRSDARYRQILLSLYGALISTGRAKDITASVSAATGVESESVSAPEDTANLEYDVVIEDWKRENAIGPIRDAAEIADASVVTLDAVKHKLSLLDDPLRDLWTLSSGSIQLSDGDGALAQRVDEILVGDGTDASASGMQNTLHTGNVGQGTATETRVGTNTYELATTVTGGQEVPAGAELTEFGAKTTGANNELVGRQVREPVTVASGETTTIIQPIEYLRA